MPPANYILELYSSVANDMLIYVLLNNPASFYEQLHNNVSSFTELAYDMSAYRIPCHNLQNSTAQDYLFQWVRGVEREMNASGVPVINPRKQLFHCTLALVDTHQYPVQPALAAVARAVPLFSTVTFDQFFVNGRQIRPSTDTAV